MRRLPAGLVLAGLVALLVAVDATPAAACSCPAPAAPSADRQHFARATAVFEGTVVESQLVGTSGGLRSSTDPEVFTFAVERVHKGPVSERQDVVTEESGASCGLEVEVGGSYLVFAGEPSSVTSPRPTEGQYYAGLCGGTRRLSEGSLPPDLAVQATAPDRAEAARATGGGSTDGDSNAPVLLITIGMSALAGALALGALLWRRRHRTA